MKTKRERQIARDIRQAEWSCIVLFFGFMLAIPTLAEVKRKSELHPCVSVAHAVRAAGSCYLTDEQRESFISLPPPEVIF